MKHEMVNLIKINISFTAESSIPSNVVEYLHWQTIMELIFLNTRKTVVFKIRSFSDSKTKFSSEKICMLSLFQFPYKALRLSISWKTNGDHFWYTMLICKSVRNSDALAQTSQSINQMFTNSFFFEMPVADPVSWR